MSIQINHPFALHHVGLLDALEVFERVVNTKYIFAHIYNDVFRRLINTDKIAIFMMRHAVSSPQLHDQAYSMLFNILQEKVHQINFEFFDADLADDSKIIMLVKRSDEEHLNDKKTIFANKKVFDAATKVDLTEIQLQRIRCVFLAAAIHELSHILLRYMMEILFCKLDPELWKNFTQTPLKCGGPIRTMLGERGELGFVAEEVVYGGALVPLTMEPALWFRAPVFLQLPVDLTALNSSSITIRGVRVGVSHEVLQLHYTTFKAACFARNAPAALPYLTSLQQDCWLPSVSLDTRLLASVAAAVAASQRSAGTLVGIASGWFIVDGVYVDSVSYQDVVEHTVFKEYATHLSLTKHTTVSLAEAETQLDVVHLTKVCPNCDGGEDNEIKDDEGKESQKYSDIAKRIVFAQHDMDMLDEVGLTAHSAATNSADIVV